MSIKKTVQNFFNMEDLFEKNLLLSVSGGVDSMVLLDVACKNFPAEQIAVFHLHHAVRESSDEDFSLVQEICSKEGVKFYGYRLESVPEKDRENFWRKERKRLGAQAMKGFGADRILTAHHATDLVETMIFRLVKGAGLSGMSPFDTSTKPFWKIPKSDILAYAQKHNLAYREDETNQNLDHHRNLIRHKVLPELRHITPNLEKVFVQESVIFGEASEFLEGQMQENYAPFFEQKNCSIKTFESFPFVMKRLFLRKIGGNMSFSEMEDALRWLENNPQGGSYKKVGNTVIKIENQRMCWEA